MAKRHGTQKLARSGNAPSPCYFWNGHSYTDRDFDKTGQRLDEAQGEIVQREEEADQIGVREIQESLADD